jgi:hypothetical protein
MTSAALKLLACALMVVDHLGSIFFPHEPIMRAIGRLAYPMFAYLIAEGYSHSRDKTSYLGRLFLFSLVSQPFYMFAFQYPVVHFNVFFTLAAGLYAIYAYEQKKSFLPVFFAGISTEFVKASYGLPGVFMIFAMHYFMGNHKKMFLWVFITAALCTLRGIVWRYFDDPNFVPTLTYILPHARVSLMEPLAALSVPIIAMYNGKLGPKLKYFFYAFYPGHLAILGTIRWLISR